MGECVYPAAFLLIVRRPSFRETSILSGSTGRAVRRARRARRSRRTSLGIYNGTSAPPRHNPQGLPGWVAHLTPHHNRRPGPLHEDWPWTWCLQFTLVPSRPHCNAGHRSAPRRERTITYPISHRSCMVTTLDPPAQQRRPCHTAWPCLPAPAPLHLPIAAVATGEDAHRPTDPQHPTAAAEAHAR